MWRRRRHSRSVRGRNFVNRLRRSMPGSGVPGLGASAASAARRAPAEETQEEVQVFVRRLRILQQIRALLDLLALRLQEFDGLERPGAPRLQMLQHVLSGRLRPVVQIRKKGSLHKYLSSP